MRRKVSMTSPMVTPRVAVSRARPAGVAARPSARAQCGQSAKSSPENALVQISQ
jgi:hypothetical protein